MTAPRALHVESTLFEYCGRDMFNAMNCQGLLPPRQIASSFGYEEGAVCLYSCCRRVHGPLAGFGVSSKFKASHISRYVEL